MKNFPHYHQLDAKDCGPTCLRMEHYSFIFRETRDVADILKEHRNDLNIVLEY